MPLARRLPPLNPLRAFEAAARHGHVGRAALELSVTHGAVSHQVRALEAALGVDLFERRGRHIKLSQAGQFLLPSVRQALDLIADAAGRILLPRLEGRLVIHASPGILGRWLVRRIGRFIEAYPKIDLSLGLYRGSQPAASDEADVVIEYGSGEWERKWVQLLRPIEFFPVCSPRLLNAAAPLRTAGDLREHRLLHDDDGQGWGRWLAAAGAGDVDSGRGIRFANANLSLDAAVHGYGVALGDQILAAEDLASGALVRPFEASVPAINGYFAVCNQDRLALPMVRAFLEWLQAEIGAGSAGA